MNENCLCENEKKEKLRFLIVKMIKFDEKQKAMTYDMRVSKQPETNTMCFVNSIHLSFSNHHHHHYLLYKTNKQPENLNFYRSFSKNQIQFDFSPSENDNYHILFYKKKT